MPSADQQNAMQARINFKQKLDEIPKMKPTKLILLVGWSLAMSALDNTIVNIANPQIQIDSHFVPKGSQIPQSTLQWINDIYSVAFAAFAIPASKIGDRFGVTIVHRYGVFGFVICSVFCGISRFIPYTITPWKYGGFFVLIFVRFFQGIFAAFLMANSMTLCGILVKQEDIAKSMAMNSLAFAAATALGPPLGGILTDYAGWEWCFFINLFIGIISIALCWKYLPITPKFQEAKLDWFGGVIVLIGLMVMIFGFTYIPPEKGAISVGIVSTLAGFGIIFAFVVWETVHPYAILPKSLLFNQKIMYSLFAGFFNFALIVTVSFQLPFALQSIHGYSPTTVGLVSLVNPIFQIGSAFAAQYLAKKITSYIIKIVSSVIVSVFVIMLGFIIQYSLPWIVVNNCFFSFFLGIFFVSNNQFMMQVATPDIRGMIGGCIQAFRETGYAVGIAFVNLIHDLAMSHNWGTRPIPDRESDDFAAYSKAYFSAFCTTDLVMSVVSILAMVFGMLSGTNQHESKLYGYPKKLLLQEQAALIEAGNDEANNEEVEDLNVEKSQKSNKRNSLTDSSETD